MAELELQLEPEPEPERTGPGAIIGPMNMHNAQCNAHIWPWPNPRHIATLWSPWLMNPRCQCPPLPTLRRRPPSVACFNCNYVAAIAVAVALTVAVVAAAAAVKRKGKCAKVELECGFGTERKDSTTLHINNCYGKYIEYL